MNKNIILTATLCIGLCMSAFSGNGGKFRISREPQSGRIDKEISATNFLATGVRKQNPHSGSPSDVSWVFIDSLSNAFGPSYADIDPLMYDPWSDALAMIHRGHPSYATNGGTGSIWYNYSVDNSLTWTRTPAQLNADIPIWGRYPSCTISNPAHSTNPISSIVQFSYPQLNPSSFGYICYGLDPFSAGTPFAVEYHGDNNYSSSTYIWTSDDGQPNVYFLVKDGASQPLSLKFWRTTNQGEVWQEKTTFVSVNVWSTLYSERGVCIGNTIYIGCTIRQGTATSPVVFAEKKSTDNGETWNDWNIIDWRTIPALSAFEDFGSIYGRLAFDFVVDANGMEHYFFTALDTDQNDPAQQMKIVEAYRTVNGWDGKIIASRTSTFVPGFADLEQMDDELRVSVSKERNYIAVKWVDAPSEGETAGDIFIRGRKINNDYGPIKNVTQTGGAYGREMSTHIAPFLKYDGTNATVFLTKTEPLVITPDSLLVSTAPAGLWGAKYTWNVNDGLLPSVSGTVFNDVNNNGIKDSGEPGLAQWELHLVVNTPNPPAPTVTTSDNNGNYIFTNVAANTYKLREVHKNNWIQTLPLDSNYIVTVAGQDITGKNFGNHSTFSSISGVVFNDRNNNGTRDPNEPGLSNWTVTITTSSPPSTQTTISGNEGGYIFNELTANTYTVSETVQPNWNQTSPQQPGTYTITLSNGQNVTGNNFGNFNVQAFNLPTIVFVRDVPFDQGGQALVKWNASGLDTNVNTFPYYSVWRAIPGVGKQNEHSSTEGNFSGHNSFYRIVNGVLYSWQWVGDEPALRFPDYSYAAPTLYDSSSRTNGKHYFLVVAHTANPNVFFLSNVDSGHSVDNIAPHAAKNLSGAKTGQTVVLHWNSSGDADLANYNVYRSTTPNINPDILSPIGQTTDTSFIDQSLPLANTLYYLVRARDIHDNAGEPSNVAPVIILGIAGNGSEIPKEFALHQNYPNPFNPTTNIRFDVPSEAFVTLKVFDVLGREMAVVVNKQLSAGSYSVDFDASSLQSGVYFYRFTGTAGNGNIFTAMQKMVVMK